MVDDMSKSSVVLLSETLLQDDADARPKHKHIVTPSWVTESIEEETLMNEDGGNMLSNY